MVQAKELCKQIERDTNNGNGNCSIIDDIDLVVVSPLTRAFQTFEYGLLPHLLKNDNNSMRISDYLLDRNAIALGELSLKVPVISLPLASERVYLKSDLGLPVEQLRSKFPYADLSSEFDYFENEWWFTVKDKDDNEREDLDVDGKGMKKNIHSFNSMDASEYIEWRPSSEGQTYACLGEPDKQFNQRMIALCEWLESREESNIALISHWGVLEWLTGLEFENCEMKVISFDCVKEHVEVNHMTAK